MRQRPEYDPKVIGKNLRRLREGKRLSVEDVRGYLALGSVQAVYKYEAGKGFPPADTMFALMELYDASLSDIICDHEEDRASSSPVFTCNPSNGGYAFDRWCPAAMQARRIRLYYDMCNLISEKLKMQGV